MTVLALAGPLVLGAVFGYWLGRSGFGVMTALGVGGGLTLIGLGIWYADAPMSPLDCYECNEYWGRWMDQTMFSVWLPLTLALWSVGVAVGVSKRRADHQGRLSTSGKAQLAREARASSRAGHVRPLLVRRRCACIPKS